MLLVGVTVLLDWTFVLVGGVYVPVTFKPAVEVNVFPLTTSAAVALPNSAALTFNVKITSL